MIEYIVGGSILFITLLCLISWYRVVPQSEAHSVVTPKKRFTVSADSKIGSTKYYFKIPSWIPFFGRVVRIMDTTIKEKITDQETYEKDQARFMVKSSTKYRVTDVEKASETFSDDGDLNSMLEEIIKSTVRAVTVNFNIETVRGERKKVEDSVRKEMEDDLDAWGLKLINFQLVDFRDVQGLTVLKDISQKREVAINSKTREDNAEMRKQADIKEADADEKSKSRQIQRDKVIAEEQEKQKQAVAEQEKLAEQKKYAVEEVKAVRQAEIDKAKAKIDAEKVKEVAIIKANQDREAEEITKKQKHLEGEGDKLRAEEKAKGESAPIREKGNAEAEIIKAKGLAEAEAKDKLAKALKQFDEVAIRSLVAEKIVEMQKEVGVAGAKALEKADLKVFSGSGDSTGFDVGQMVESIMTSSETTGKATLNKIARPNDLGLTALGLEKLKEDSKYKKSDTKK